MPQPESPRPVDQPVAASEQTSASPDNRIATAAESALAALIEHDERRAELLANATYRVIAEALPDLDPAEAVQVAKAIIGSIRLHVSVEELLARIDHEIRRLNDSTAVIR